MVPTSATEPLGYRRNGHPLSVDSASPSRTPGMEAVGRASFNRSWLAMASYDVLSSKWFETKADCFHNLPERRLGARYKGPIPAQLTEKLERLWVNAEALRFTIMTRFLVQAEFLNDLAARRASERAIPCEPQYPFPELLGLPANTNAALIWRA